MPSLYFPSVSALLETHDVGRDDEGQFFLRRKGGVGPGEVGGEGGVVEEGEGVGTGADDVLAGGGPFFAKDGGRGGGEEGAEGSCPRPQDNDGVAQHRPLPFPAPGRGGDGAVQGRIFPIKAVHLLPVVLGTADMLFAPDPPVRVVTEG